MRHIIAIESFIEKFTDQHLMHVEKVGRQYFQIVPALKERMLEINKNLGREPFSAGLFLGEEKGKIFKPSIALVDLVAKASQRWIMVDENAEWLFLCGRDIFAKSVIKANVKSGLAIVRSRRGEVLGYGKITGSLDKSDKIFLKNILDRGDYLRREMTKRKSIKKR